MRPKAHPQLGPRFAAAALALAAAASAYGAAPPAAGGAAVVAGRVVDAAGHPIAGAKASVLGEDEKVLGSAVAGKAGRFEIALRPARLPEITVQVEAAGFEGWQGYPEPGERSHLSVVLHRQIDRAFVDRLVATPGSQRRDGVIEVLAGGAQDGLYEAVFPALGALRQNLREVVLQTPRGGDAGNDIQDEAQQLLALWGDPADAALLAPWLDKHSSFRDEPPDARGATLAAACQAWTVAHFQAEHAPQPWTWHLCSEPVLDPAGTRALVRFEVRYAHWEYEMYLVFVLREKTWTLRTALLSWIS